MAQGSRRALLVIVLTIDVQHDHFTFAMPVTHPAGRFQRIAV
jgi:hypothetical protein